MAIPDVCSVSLSLKVKGLSELHKVLIFLSRSVGDDQAHVFPPPGCSVSEIERRLAGGVPFTASAQETGVGLVRVDGQQGLERVSARQVGLGELGYCV